jgi:hypothetical protein
MAKSSKASKSTKAPKLPKISASAKRTKGELFKLLGEHNGLSRKQVAGLFDTLSQVMAVDLAKPGKDKPKVFVVPGLMKVTSRFKPAVGARKGIDPFTKQEKMFKAKPASTGIKIRPLKGLKEMVS